MLASAELKFDRANQHLDQLDDTIRKYLDDDPHRVTGHNDTDSSGTVSVEVMRDFPADVGLLAGEVAHGLRCVLDHVVYAISIGRSKRGSYFPICTVEADYIGPRTDCVRPMRDQGLAGVPKRLIAIFDAAQPYHWKTKAATHPLACISRLDNADKHRAIQPASAVAEDLASIRIQHPPIPTVTGEPREANIEWLSQGQMLKVGTKTDVLRWRITPPLPPDTKVRVRLQPRIGVVFGERCAVTDLNAARDYIAVEIIDPIKTKIG